MRRYLFPLLAVVVFGAGGTLLAIAAIILVDQLLQLTWPFLAHEWGGLATGSIILGIVAICGWTTRHGR